MSAKGGLKNKLWFRHLIIAILSCLTVFFFWMTRPEWDAEMRFWRAVGDGSLMLLWLSLVIGPLSRIWLPVKRLLNWRREIGIWCGILALMHGLLILNGWVRWDIMRFFGYEFIPQLGRMARIEAGFGLANVLGILALFWTLILTATSSNWALNRLGNSAWKWLHNGAYIAFYLIVSHAFYFLFIHYTPSFHREVPSGANWFQIPFLVLSLSVPVLQGLGFISTVRQRSSATERHTGTRRKI